MKNKKIYLFLAIFLATIIFSNFIFMQKLDNKESTGRVVLLAQEKNNYDNLLSDYPEEDNVELKKSSRSNSKKYSKSQSIADETGDLSVTFFTNKSETNLSYSDGDKAVSGDDESGKIFKRAGIEYVLRGGEEYQILGIEFSPLPPSEVCVSSNGNGYADLTITGKALIEFEYRWKCVFPGGDNYKLKVRIMDADSLSGDDIINEVTLDINRQCYTQEELYVPFSYTFNSVNLGREFGGAEDSGTIEIYATVEPLDKKTIKHSTKNYNVNKNSNCQCSSGECCDLSSKKFKPSGSQPDKYSDANYCAGSSGVTRTSYVMTKDWYCDGKSSSAQSQDSVKDTCGVCKYCTEGSSSCGNYDSSTICGANQHCDGRGSCIACRSHTSSSCYDSDVYWINECNVREEKRTECGTDSCDFWTKFCRSNQLWERRTCYSKGCSGSGCYSNPKNEEQFVQTCSYKCEGSGNSAGCVLNPDINCYSRSDCAKTGFEGEPFCFEGNINQYQIIDYSCINPGQTSSYCDYKTQRVLKQSCQYGCVNGQCNSAPVGKLPDLTVEDLVVQGINGLEAVLGFTIKNIGEATSNSIYWIADTGSLDSNPKRTSPISLEPGNFTRAFLVLNYSKSGNYSAKVIVDYDKMVTESNENNNEKIISVKV